MKEKFINALKIAILEIKNDKECKDYEQCLHSLFNTIFEELDLTEFDPDHRIESIIGYYSTMIYDLRASSDYWEMKCNEIAKDFEVLKKIINN